MKALLFNVNAARFVAIQALRPLSARACYAGPLATIKLADIPEPSLPSPEWVKIKTKICGVCGSDINLVMLKDSPTASPFTSFPCVPGHELCGEVVEAGSGVKNCRPGDMVTVMPFLGCEPRGIRPVCKSCASGSPCACENFAEGEFSPGMFIGICRDLTGGFAEYLVAHKSQVYRLPAGVSPEAACLTEPLAVGLQAVMDNMPDKGEKTLVIGGGVIGAMVVKSIRAIAPRCDVTVIEPSPFVADYCKQSGADRVVAGGILETAVEHAGGRAYRPLLGERVVMGGFDRIYDTVGHAETLNLSLRALASNGTLSVIGIGKNVKLDLTPLWLKLQTIRGCYGYRSTPVKGGKSRQTFESALDLIAKKKVRVNDMLTHTFAIEDFREMIDINLAKSRHRAIKTAIVF